MTDLRFRQVHLDFHTSEQITGIGEQFDPDAFADTLVKARVNSVTCFARCHHGWIYYDTQKFPERRHPHLKRNLLVEQIEACHKRDIRVPIYTTIQWDQFTANAHPEWLALDADGRIKGTPPYEAGFYRWLLVNSPYMDFLKAHIAEIFDLMPVDGLFLDIVQPVDDSSKWSRDAMVAKGQDPTDPLVRRAYGQQALNDFKVEMSAYIRSFNKDCTIFYNAGHIGPRHRPLADAYSHFEIESLPSGNWGYTHFPMAVRYARNLGLDVMGMTGKFHTTWGDFHSFKNQAALEFECFNMLANAAKCSIGDQLHPNGKIDPVTYDLIGSVYAAVEAKEPWCAGVTPLVDIGVMTPEEFSQERIPAASAGVVSILQEGGHQFDFIDSQSDFSRYKVIILPDEIRVNQTLAAKIEKYLADGGALIATHESGLDEDQDMFRLKALGIALRGQAFYSPDFVMPQDEIGKGLPQTEHVMYMRGLEVELDGAKLLADGIVPYFNRTWEHFCSHNHTPSAGRTSYPAIVQNGRAIYFMHPIFKQYNHNAPRWVKTLLLNALEMLLPEPLVRHDGPSTLITTLNEQAAQNRQVLHMLHYIPVRRSATIDVIEDVIPVYDVPVSVRLGEQAVKSVTLVPDGETLTFEQDGVYVRFTVPVVSGHQMVALER